MSALHASFDYQSQPITGKSPEESSYRRNHGRVIVSAIAKSKTTEPKRMTALSRLQSLNLSYNLPPV